MNCFSFFCFAFSNSFDSNKLSSIHWTQMELNCILIYGKSNVFKPRAKFIKLKFMSQSAISFLSAKCVIRPTSRQVYKCAKNCLIPLIYYICSCLAHGMKRI